MSRKYGPYDSRHERDVALTMYGVYYRPSQADGWHSHMTTDPTAAANIYIDLAASGCEVLSTWHRVHAIRSANLTEETERALLAAHDAEK